MQYAVINIINYRSSRDTPACALFVGAEKAFDRVEQELLVFVLKTMTFGSNFISVLYPNTIENCLLTF